MKNLQYYLCLLVIGLTATDAITVVEGITYGRISFILLCLVSMFSPEIFIPRKKGFLKILLFFILYVWITTIFSSNIEITIGALLYLVQYFVIIVMADNIINTPRKIRAMFVAYVIGVLYISIISIFDYSFAKQAGDTADGLYRTDIVGNSNENSFMIAYAIIISFILIINKKNKRLYNTFLFFIMAVLILAVISNGSRMGFLLVFAFIVILILNYSIKFRIKQMMIVSFGIIIIGFISYNFIAGSTLERLINIQSDIESNNLSNRDWIWSKAIEMIEKPDFNILIGNGWGTFAEAFKNFTGTLYGAHNFYLNVFFTSGILGSSIILVYFVILYLKINRMNCENKLVYYSLIIIPLMSMMSTNWESRRWWFLMGLIIYKLDDIVNNINTIKKIRSNAK